MTGRTAAAGLLVVALGGLLSAQGPPADRLVVVTNDSSLHLQVWRSRASGYERIWEARPRAADPATWDKRRNEAVATGRDAPLVIADLDRDGANELIVTDGYGVVVYGRSPASYPFATATPGSMIQMAVGDADGDGMPEIVTMQAVTGTEPGREIEVLKVGAGGIRSLWRQKLAGYPGALALEDTDNDRQKEIVAGGDTLSILKRRAGPTWEVVADLPNIGSVNALRVADVDRDGKNEVVATGSGGKVTIYKYRKQGQREGYPVLWQSPYLITDGLKPGQMGGPFAQTQVTAVADVDGDKQPELLVSTMELGKLGDREVRSARLHIFRFDGQRDFVKDWTSDFLSYTSVSALSAGDLDGDGVAEVVVNGRDVYKRDQATKAYRAVAPLCSTCTDAVVGELGDLREPAATRVVPLYWTLGRQVSEGQTADVAVTLLSAWNEAKDVTVTVKSANPRFTVENAVIRVPAIPAGGTFTTPAFKATARAGDQPGVLQFDIATADGYRQTVQSGSIYVGPPLPTYGPDAEARLASALASARDENRRVLIQWGTNGDKASDALILTTSKGAEVPRTLMYEYEVVRAEVKGNERLAAKYQVKAPLPYLTVLDGQGKLLASQPVASFKATGEAAAAYDAKKLNEFLKKYQAAYVAAEPLFTQALSQAKKDQKTLFLWFSAPW